MQEKNAMTYGIIVFIGICWSLYRVEKHLQKLYDLIDQLRERIVELEKK